MNPVDAFWAGIAPEHAPALLAGVLAAAWLAVRPGLATDAARRWALALLGATAAVHLALPLRPHHGLGAAAGFVAVGIGFAVVAARVRAARPWRLPAALLSAATLVAWLAAVVTGEEADQVGIVTALVEIAVVGLAIPPSRRVASTLTTAVAVFVTGAVVWVASFAAHAAPPPGTPGAAPASATTADPATTSGRGDPSGPRAADGHGGAGEHAHAGRTQAGMLMRPDHHGASATPTPEQAAVAADLVTRTRAATAAWRTVDAALAAGFEPAQRMQGTDVHLEHPGHAADGVTLDPARPEMLVFAIEDGRASLLGVVFVMPRAGVPGPQPGGPLTSWHAHNLCLTAAPPGFGVVSPFGGCPAFSVAVASPEMTHLWTVDNPRGPHADTLDDAWIREHVATAGLPYRG